MYDPTVVREVVSVGCVDFVFRCDEVDCVSVMSSRDSIPCYTNCSAVEVA